MVGRRKTATFCIAQDALISVAFEKDINPLDLLKAYYIKKRDEISALDAYRKAKEEVTYRVKNS